MGALDDLLARDEANMKRGAGGMTPLDQLLANDEARNLPSNDPEIPIEEAPGFIGYDPANAPQPEASPWEGLRSFASSLMDPNTPENQQLIEGGRKWRADQGGYEGITDNLAEAYVGSKLPGAGKGAGFLRRMAVEGAESAGMTAADKAGDYMRGEEGDLREDAREVAESGLFGAGGGAAGKLISGAAGKVKGWAGSAASKAKNLVAGQGVRDAKAIAAEHGVDAIDEAGQLLEKYSPSGLTGKSAESHLKTVGPEREAVGEDLRQMAQQINGQLAPDDLPRARGALQDGLQAEATRVADALPEDQVQYGGAINQLQQRLARKPDFESFPALIGEKSGLQGFGHSGPGGSVPEGAQKQAAAYGGGVLKDEVRRIVEGMPPELRDRYIAQNQNFADLSGLEESLRNKAAAEAQGGDLGGIVGSSAVAGLLGAGTGAALDDDPLAGAAKGGASGFLAGFGLQGGAGATRTALRQGGGSRLTDAGANMLRGIERGAGELEELGSMAGPASSFAERRAEKREQTEKPGAQIAVGPTKLAQVLKTNPARLGQFAELFKDVINDQRALEQRAKNISAREPMFRKLYREIEAESTESRPQSGITFSLEGE